MTAQVSMSEVERLALVLQSVCCHALVLASWQRHARAPTDVLASSDALYRNALTYARSVLEQPVVTVTVETP